MSTRFRKAQKLQQRPPDPTKRTHHSSSNEAAGYTTPQGSGDVSVEPSTTVEFATVGIKGFLDFDPRPTFVVTQDSDLEGEMEPIFANIALRSNIQLIKGLSIKTKYNTPQSSPKLSTTEFRAWLKEISQLEYHAQSDSATFSFWGFLWTAFILHGKWLIVSGSNREVKSISGVVPVRSDSSSGRRTDTQKSADSPSISDDDILDQESPLDAPARSLFMSGVTPDWTLPQPSNDLSPHVIFARSIDWGSTPLGDMSTWSPEFRQVACLLMANPHPAALFVCVSLSVLPLLAFL
jgi:hypothetical protein